MQPRARQFTRLAVAVITALAVSWGHSIAIAQQGQPIEDKPIDAAKQAEIIDSVTKALIDVYVFPDVAKKMDKHVRDQLKKKAYTPITSTRAFAEKLTEDLRSISHDLHLHVDYLPDEDIAMIQGDTADGGGRQRDLENARRNNFAFRELKILPGNIGYLNFTGFSGHPEAGPTAVAAMNFLANCDAVIFDVRQNGGGSPAMIQLLSSYLFDESKHLNSFYIRRTDSIEQYWTPAHVSGPRMSDVDVYVLTSGRTFSAAEEFTYNLKNMKRATIVGDTTGGGAHPVEFNYWANLNLSMSLPFGRAINPITGTNWEGTGVAPDIVVPADQALEAAQKDALTKRFARTSGEDEKYQLQWAIDGLEAKLNPRSIDVSKLTRYAGAYGPRSIKLENGALYYRRGENPWAKMIPMSESLFRFDAFDYFRLEVVTDASGQPTELVGHYDNGMVDKSPRTGD
ncbi:MAG: S41 family peptidase [Candidatus Zixiibacteriota bacterium]